MAKSKQQLDDESSESVTPETDESESPRTLEANDRLTASELGIKLNATRAVIERVKLITDGSDSEKQRLVTECGEWLDFAQSALKQSRPWRRFFALDTAYACLHYIRHHFCELLPMDQLYRLAQEIKFDLFYIRDEIERGTCRQGIESIAAYLDPSTPLLTAEGKKIPEAKLRHDLVRQSMVVAHHREAMWQKVNLMRARLLTTMVVLNGLLVASIFFVPFVVETLTQPPKTEIHWYHISGLQIFGAMGGALSALLTREPLRLDIAQYYLKQTLLYLRPAVGAGAGLALGLLQLSGAVSILPSDSNELNWVIVLLVSFLGGFSERLFLGRLDQLLEQEAAEEAPKETPSVKPKGPEKPTSPEEQPKSSITRQTPKAGGKQKGSRRPRSSSGPRSRRRKGSGRKTRA